MYRGKICRGNIFFARLHGFGHEQQGIRPFVIISNNDCNGNSTTVTGVPLTSQKKKGLPTHSKMSTSTGINQNSIALAECITTIDKTLLLERVGECSARDMLKIEICVLVQVGINIVSLIKNMFMKEVDVDERSIKYIGDVTEYNS